MIPWLPEPELLIAGSVAPPIRASDAALVRITMDEERSFASKPRSHCFSSVAPICSPHLPLKPSCDNAQFSFAESRIKRIAANGTSLTNFRISASVVLESTASGDSCSPSATHACWVNTTPSCVSICTMLVCPPTIVTHAHFSPFQTLAREKRISLQGSWILTETFPAASSALASAIACAVASFSTSSPALAFPPNAPSAAAIGSPTIPVPGTVTPRPFFIRFGETQASTRSTGPSSSAAATAAASASEIGSVHPSAGFTSS